MTKRRSSKQRPAERPIDHEAIAEALGGLEAPVEQIADQRPVHAPAQAVDPRQFPLVQVLRHVAGFTYGQTARLTPELTAQLQAHEYRVIEQPEQLAASPGAPVKRPSSLELKVPVHRDQLKRGTKMMSFAMRDDAPDDTYRPPPAWRTRPFGGG